MMAPMLNNLTNDLLVNIFVRAGRFLLLWRTCKEFRRIAEAAAHDKCEARLWIMHPHRSNPHPQVFHRLVPSLRLIPMNHWYRSDDIPSTSFFAERPHSTLLSGCEFQASVNALKRIVSGPNVLRKLDASGAVLLFGDWEASGIEECVGGLTELDLSCTILLGGRKEVGLEEVWQMSLKPLNRGPYSYMEQAIYTTLTRMLCKATELRTLVMKCSYLGNVGAYAIGTSLKHMPSITHLDLSGNIICWKGGCVLGQNLMHMTSLQSLNLEFNRLGEQGATGLSIGLRRCTTLRVLKLGSNEIEDQGAELILQAVGKLVEIRELSLKSNGLMLPGGAAAGHALQNTRLMCKLDLSGVSLYDEGASFVANSFHCMPLLESLDLSVNTIEDDGMVDIAINLRHLSNLHTLNLSHNRMGIDGAFAVAASFRYMPNLKKAEMAFNPTTLQGAIAFANTLSYMTYLRHLNLTSCVLSMGEVLQLREAVDRARGIEASLEIDARFLL